MMKAASFSDMSVYLHHITRRHVAEGGNFIVKAVKAFNPLALPEVKNEGISLETSVPIYELTCHKRPKQLESLFVLF
jgi:hypothetical protein